MSERQCLDTILVLTGPLRYRDREQKAVDIWNGRDEQYILRPEAQIIISGDYTGFADYMGEAPPAEPDAMVMKCRMLEMGIPEERFIVEPEAKDTVANFVYSVPRILETGSQNVGIVTSKYHMRRTMRIGDHAAGDRLSLYACPSNNGGSALTTVQEAIIALIIDYDLRNIRRGDQEGFEEYLRTKHPFHGANPGGLYTWFVRRQKQLFEAKQRVLPHTESHTT